MTESGGGVFLLLLLTACGSGAEPSSPRAGAADEVVLLRGGACPEAMSPVSDAQGVAYCIDTWEVTVEGELGDRNQRMPEAEPTLATAVSAPGQRPVVGVSFDQAFAACENTPVLDGRGREVGRKRLASSQEWEDAADGVMGPGGKVYAFGDDWDVSICRVPGHPEAGEVGRVGLTGSLVGCRSPVGTYDQTGNAWEWADSGAYVDIEGWFELAAQLGLTPERVSTGEVALKSLLNPQNVLVDMAGLLNGVVQVGPAGTIGLARDQVDSRARGVAWTGYLVLRPRQPLPPGVAMGTNFLPVTLDPPPGQGEAPPKLVVLEKADGVPLPDKRGCSSYAGNDHSCRNRSANLGHFHDFVGTVGFRCVSDPLP